MMRYGTIYQKSDLVVIPYPFTDLSSQKLRPVLILRTPNQKGDFLAVQITSKAGHALAEPILNSDLAIGQRPKTSYIRPDKLITLNLSLIHKRIAQLSPEATDKFDQLVCQTLLC